MGRSASVVVSIAVGMLSLFATSIAACNLHELSHLVVSRILGLDVQSVSWCLPGGGEILLSDPPPAVERYAGGLGAAALLLLAYLALARRGIPARTLQAFALTMPLPGVAAMQTTLGMIEGASPTLTGRPYLDLIADAPLVFVPLLVGALLAGMVWHAARWWRPLRGASGAG